MATQLTSRDVRDSLNAHVAAKGDEVFRRYGPRLGWTELLELLRDPACVRYPCEIVFDSEHLLAGECAHPVGNGERPEDGFKIFVHPFFMTQLDRVPYLVLYQMVLVNYGEFATAEDAEVFGANALGLAQGQYYQAMCELADQLAPPEPASPGSVLA